jgi:hypothetical protein
VVTWDGDGRKDLLIGQGDGKVRIYLNINTDADPKFDGGTFLQVGAPGSKTDISVGGRATPLVADWNNDGKKDLLVGDINGKISLYLNEGTDAAPDFRVRVYVQNSGADLVVPSLRASPLVADLNGDGRKDLLSGNTNGQLLLYPNTGADDSPAFTGYSYVQSQGVAIDLPSTLRSRPFAADFNGDGQWDLLAGNGDGFVRLWREDDSPIVIHLEKSADAVRLDWTPTGADRYNVLFASSPSAASFGLLPGGNLITPPVYHDGAVSNGNTYYYDVRRQY